MIISKNISSLNAINNFKMNEDRKFKSMTKLASGFRINQSADDAAGLAISEKMRAQIKGLGQASKNIDDGISMVRTADGAMEEMHSILQRLRELSVQSSNGTYTDGDRQALDAETRQLLTELDRITETTNFNGKYLLSGQYDAKGNPIAKGPLSDYVQSITTSGGVTDTYTFQGMVPDPSDPDPANPTLPLVPASKNYASAVIDFSNINENNIYALAGKGVNYTCCTCNKAYSIKFVEGIPDNSRIDDQNPIMEVDIRSIKSGEELVKAIMKTAYGDEDFVFNPFTVEGNGGIPSKGNQVPSSASNFVTHYSQFAADGAKLYIYDDRTNNAGANWPSGDRGRFDLGVFGEAEAEKEKFYFVDLQVGSESGDIFRARFANVTNEELKILDLSLASQDQANQSISKIDSAIKQISLARADIGAYDNALMHILNNVENYSINLQDSESRIRDTDMAKEMLEFTKSNIIEEAGQAMMAHANQRPQQVLELIR